MFAISKVKSDLGVFSRLREASRVVILPVEDGKTKRDLALNFCFSITQIVYNDTDTDRVQDFNGVIIEVTNSLSEDVT